MSRLLAFALEPSDAFLALLRMKASSEAGRWPAQLSGRFRAALEREFAALESTVRAMGVCYADLEERGIATIDRAPHSRFGDIDAAMHLGACPIEVAVDLDHLKVALERGDATTRRSTAGLATSLRMVLWYAVRTDLLQCLRLQRSGEELTPDMALRFLDGYLVAAWRGSEPPQPPLPSPDLASDSPPGVIYHTPLPMPDGGSLPAQESTAIFNADALGAMDLDYLQADTGISQGAVDTSEMERLSLNHPEFDRFGAPRNAPTPPDGLPPQPPPRPISARTPRFDDSAFAASLPPSLAEVDPTSLPTLQIQMSSVLSEDARFFLAQSGARWPCDAVELESAHQVLSERLRHEPPSGIDAAMVAHWADRLDRGYDELRRWAR